VLDDELLGLTTAAARGNAVVYLHPDRLEQVVKAHKERPLAIAAYLHGVACYELTHLDGRMGEGHSERLIGRLARLDLLIIDDLRHVPTRPEHATLLFDLIEARHLRKSTMLSSSLSVKQWGRVLGNPALTASMVDRLMERAHVVNIRRGRSYRTDGPDAAPQDDRPELPEGDDERETSVDSP